MLADRDRRRVTAAASLCAFINRTGMPVKAPLIETQVYVIEALSQQHLGLKCHQILL